MNHRTKKKIKNDEHKEFEFCEVCRLNHNQGRRHNFFPRHKSSLSMLLTSFKSKLSDPKCFMRTPTFLRQDHADKYSFWCIFCNLDVSELDSPFACGNSIEHLASEEHRKRVKSFLWRYGVGIDQVDMFCIAEVDYAKWEKKCKSLKNEARAAEAVGNVACPSNNIHNDYSANNYDRSLQKNNVNFLEFKTTNSVVPLHSSTSEQAQVSCSVVSSVPKAGCSCYDKPRDMKRGERPQTPTGCHVHDCCSKKNQINSVGMENSSHNYYGNQCQVNTRGKIVNEESRCRGLIKLTQISSVSQEVVEGNVHSGAPPPWLNAEGNQVNITQKPETRKSSKLNPKRVGAAWAERRAFELEMENRGGPVAVCFDANSWLPNFGTVWQSGTRKVSRKEFEAAHKSSLEVDNLLPVQPYVSKRMFRDTSDASN